MLTYLSVLFGHLMTWLAVAAGVLYAGMVLMRFRTDRPHYRLSFDLREPGRSVEHVVIWLGVKALEGCLRMARSIWNVLLEASAEVGEWLIHLSPAVRESVRSRFLV